MHEDGARFGLNLQTGRAVPEGAYVLCIFFVKLNVNFNFSQFFFVKLNLYFNFSRVFKIPYQCAILAIGNNLEHYEVSILQS